MIMDTTMMANTSYIDQELKDDEDRNANMIIYRIMIACKQANHNALLAIFLDKNSTQKNSENEQFWNIAMLSSLESNNDDFIYFVWRMAYQLMIIHDQCKDLAAKYSFSVMNGFDEVHMINKFINIATTIIKQRLETRKKNILTMMKRKISWCDIGIMQHICCYVGVVDVVHNMNVIKMMEQCVQQICNELKNGRFKNLFTY